MRFSPDDRKASQKPAMAVAAFSLSGLMGSFKPLLDPLLGHYSVNTMGAKPATVSWQSSNLHGTYCFSPLIRRRSDGCLDREVRGAAGNALTFYRVYLIAEIII